MLNQQQYQKLLNMGLPQNQVDQVVNAAGGIQQEQPKGIGGWMTGGKEGLGGVTTAVGNILNLPSYAIGGLLNRGQQVFGSKYGQGQGQGLGVLEGIKNKRGVFSELPETLYIDPTSTTGKVIGFGGELLTPNLPISKAFNAFRKVDAVSDVSKAGGLFTKIKPIKNDVARTLLEKSYKLSDSDINKLADSIGVTNEAEKAVKVIDYLENLGLQGSNKKSLEILNQVIKPVQNKFNRIARTGGEVSRQPLVDNLLQAAVEAEKANTPASRRLSKQLFDEALLESKKIGQPLTDTDLTNRISRLFSEAGERSISDPSSANLAKAIAKSGQQARETLRPGSTVMGRNLKGLRTAEEVVGKKSRTGLGTQLINALKPSAFGAGAGALYGYSTGQNPLLSAGVGLAGGVAVNNPRVMNLAGKTLQKDFPKITNQTLLKTGKIGLETTKRLPSRLLRTYIQPNRIPQRKEESNKSQQILLNNQTYKPTISSSAPKIKSTLPTAESFYAEIRKKRGY